MVAAAVRLLATNGVEGTSFADVLALSGAPRGSVYHHFPDGKTELLRAALDYVAEQALAIMEPTRGQPLPTVVKRFLGLWQQMLDMSNLSAGCIVLAVTVASTDTSLRDHAGTIFRAWADQLADLFVAAGMKRAAARQFASTIIAATEGAVVMSRAQHSREPFDDVAATLMRLARSQTPASRGGDS